MQVSQYYFGNSLVNFAGGGPSANVPVWLDSFFEAGADELALNGGYGFLQQFADRPEPANEWGFAGVEGLWESDTQAFSDVAFDQVIITPANFIQDNAPHVNYFGVNESPLSVSDEIVDFVMQAQPKAEIFIYEGWADLGPFNEDFPPTNGQLETYFDYNKSDYHAWYETYVERLNELNPNADIRLIPVAPVLAELLENGGPLEGLAATDLYVDSAPHGTPTLYFLAALITYQATVGTQAPTGSISQSVHSDVRGNLGSIKQAIADAVEAYSGISDGGTEPLEPLFGTTGDDDMVATAQDDIIRLRSGDDTVRALEGDDNIRGAAGHDVIHAGRGVDSVIGGNGGDAIYGDNGSDVLRGNRGADELYGGTAHDLLIGGRGADLLKGQAGNDTLVSGRGSDTLGGGDGNDHFVILKARGHDLIRDFKRGEDVLDLTAHDIGSIADARGRASAQDGGVHLDLGKGSSVFLDGISLNDLFGSEGSLLL